MEQLLVMAPVDLIASKVIAYHQRRGKPKAGTDWRDIATLLLTFPELKSEMGQVRDRLQELSVEQSILEIWRELVLQDIQPEDEGDDF